MCDLSLPAHVFCIRAHRFPSDTRMFSPPLMGGSWSRIARSSLGFYLQTLVNHVCVCVRACVSVDRWDPPSKYSTRSTGSLLIVPTEVEGGDRNFPSSCGSVRLLNEGEGKRQSSSLFHFRYITSLSLPWPAPPPPPHPPPLPQPSHDFHQPARRGRGRRSGKIRSKPIISRDEFRAMSKSENGEGEGDGKGGREAEAAAAAFAESLV